MSVSVRAQLKINLSADPRADAFFTCNSSHPGSAESVAALTDAQFKARRVWMVGRMRMIFGEVDAAVGFTRGVEPGSTFLDICCAPGAPRCCANLSPSARCARLSS